MRLSNTHIFYFILLVGAVLRFWDFADIPYTHDEFSALFRTEYTNFSDLISQGVRPDGHPAGIQVFLYFWVKLFGTTEWIVKLPFALMGLASIWVIYKLGKLWFNDTVALLTAASVAFLQYPITYSVTARPYISGMFFGLMMVWYWSKLVKRPHSRLWTNGALYVLFSALCAYNHHFSLLFAALVWVSGLFFLPRKILLKYFLLGVGIFVLYIPHLDIFFHQLGNKGVEGWLAKPQPDWLWTYIRYIFHYSWILLGLVVLIIGYGLFQKSKNDFSIKKLLLFSLWFLVPFAIGYFYSVHVNAVLQFSVLIFSFPYLFFVLFGHLPDLKKGLNAILVGLVFTTSVYTLVKDRLHYHLMYNSHYEQIVTNSTLANQMDSTLKFIDSHREISKYYSTKDQVDLDDVVWLDSFKTELDLRAYLEKHAPDYKNVYLGAWATMNPNYIYVIKEFFPNKRFQFDYVGGSTYAFTKDFRPSTPTTVSKMDFSQYGTAEWSNIDTSHTMFNSVYKMDSTMEWSPIYSSTIGESTGSVNDVLWASVMIQPEESIEDVSIVAVVEEDGKNVHWSNAELKRFTNDTSGMYFLAYHTLLLNSIPCSADAQVKYFLWNKGRRNFRINQFWTSTKKGNPWVYGGIGEF